MIKYVKIINVQVIDNAYIKQNRHITKNISTNHVAHAIIFYDIQISMKNTMENANYATNERYQIIPEEKAKATQSSLNPAI